MLILKNATVLNFDPPRVLKDQDVLIEGGRIVNVGKGIAESVTAEKIIDLSGKYISPGLVCAHNHFYSALARGIVANIKPSDDFIGILQHLWWKLDRALDEESLYYSGIIGALEAVKCGTTSVIDHNASPAFISGSHQLLKECFEKAGLRGILCYEVTCRNGQEETERGIRETEDFINSLAAGHSGELPLIEAAVGAHASFTLDDSTLERLSGIVRTSGRGLHVHAGEDKYDAAWTHHSADMDIMERFGKYGLITNKSVFAHGVNLTERDLDLINSRDAFLVHNARSNMNNSVGYLNKIGTVKNIALGTDGIGSDMIEEFKFAFFKHKDAGGSMWPDDFMRMLNSGNELMSRYFNIKFGEISKGAAADITIYDYKTPTPLNENNIGGHFAFGLSSRDVESVIINGKVVYENRAFPFDTAAIYEKAACAAERLWNKFNTI